MSIESFHIMLFQRKLCLDKQKKILIESLHVKRFKLKNLAER